MPLMDRLLTDGLLASELSHVNEVFLAIRTDDSSGDGTRENPYRANTAHDFDGGGFFEDVGEAVFAVFGHDGVVAIAAGDDGSDVGVVTEELLEGFASAHAAGDGKVHDDSAKGFAGAFGLVVAEDGFGAVF